MDRKAEVQRIAPHMHELGVGRRGGWRRLQKIAERFVDDAPRRARIRRPMREIGGGERVGIALALGLARKKLGFAKRANLGDGSPESARPAWCRSAACRTRRSAPRSGRPRRRGSAPRARRAPAANRGGASPGHRRRAAQPRPGLGRREGAREIADVVVDLGEPVKQEQPLRRVEPLGRGRQRLHRRELIRRHLAERRRARNGRGRSGDRS